MLPTKTYADTSRQKASVRYIAVKNPCFITMKSVSHLVRFAYLEVRIVVVASTAPVRGNRNSVETEREDDDEKRRHIESSKRLNSTSFFPWQ